MLIAAMALAWWMRPRVIAYAKRVRDHRTRPPGLAEFETVSPEHHAAALDAWRRFEGAYRDSFDIASALARCSPVRVMFSAREDVQLAAGELRMRLPNDLEAESRFVATMEAMDASMLERIEDAKTRLHTFAHPGPIEPWFALRGLRPSNDVVV